ncbi:MAG: histidinol-phosphate transaminase [Pseudohongiellaceae bacterium]
MPRQNPKTTHSKLQRSAIAGMQGYTPGEQPSEDGFIKLNTNENPYPPGPAVQAALANLDAAQLRRYPPPRADEFRTTAAALHGVQAGNIIPTNGGDELLRLAFTTFADGGDEIVVTEPGYAIYPVLAAIQECSLQQIELDDDFGVPADFPERMAQSSAKMLLLVNPHAPSGKLLSADYLASVAAAFKGVLLIDEAYADFVDPGQHYNAIKLINEYDNVLILRTLSKGYSLAGLRFGYGIGAESLVAPMMFKTRDSYNTDYIAQQLATAALNDVDYARSTWERVRQERAVLTAGLEKLGFDVVPSQTNFVFAQMSQASAAEGLYTALKARKILVRYFNQPRSAHALRITVGSAEENIGLLDALADIMARGVGES